NLLTAPPAPLFLLDNATVVRAGDGVVFRDLTWAVREGETWAVVGPVGSGKTTLAEVIVGQHRVESGSVAWPLLDRLRAARRPRVVASPGRPRRLFEGATPPPPLPPPLLPAALQLHRTPGRHHPRRLPALR